MTGEVDVVELQKSNLQLRKIVFSLVNEKKRIEMKLVGVQSLGEQLREKDEQIRKLKERYEQIQNTLARAENRIAQLNHQSVNGPVTPFRGSIVTPGVSKKVLDALTKENTKLKLTLNHLTKSFQNGTDVATENKDLKELVLSQKNQLRQKYNEIEELKAALVATQEHDTETLQKQVNRLSVQESKLERQLSAKQAFCETLVTENERLKELVQTVQNERVTEVSSLKKQLGKIMQMSPELKKILDQVACDDEDGSEVDVSVAEVTELRAQLEESRVGVQQREDELRSLTEVCKNLESLLNEKEGHLELAKRNVDDLKGQVEAFSSGRQENEQLKQELEAIRKAYGFLKQEEQLRQEALKEYEDAWRRERTENTKIRAENNQLQQRVREVQNKCASLTKDNNLLTRQHSKLQSPLSPPQALLRSTPRPQSCAMQMRQPWQLPDHCKYGAPVLADYDKEEPDCKSPTEQQHHHHQQQQQQQQLAPTPAPRHSQLSSDVRCPVCEEQFPCDLIESHIRDCLGD